ncbi:LytR/AlgR family response regulator transcription factor [Marinilactibacillus piezotolerans]|uniref:LytR/AlgR family response regulator transcription factor n=1 Tax=Marinilactibacillus piezotolerans TaxID=258723 RepID=UPI0009B08DB9|nr:LytTR family DNA-binding domain-containing protein [Marinilactibacillus piezotolerans]
MIETVHIAIVDDEAIQLSTMTLLLKKAADEMKLPIQIAAFSSGEAFLFELEEHPDLNMIFLDIEMKQVDGLKVAQSIRQIDQELTIVFATAYAEYAVQGYDVQALDYLLKPIEVDKIKRVFQRYLDRKPTAKSFMTIETGGETAKLFLEDILYIEVNKRECEIHLNDQVIIVHQTLKELLDKLDDTFIQTHRSYVVNLSHIERLLKSDAELSNKKIVPVSRRLSKAVQEQFVQYHKGTVFYND